MSLKGVFTKQYSLSDVTEFLRPEKLLKRAKLRFVPMRGGVALSGEQKVVLLPLRTLSLSGFNFPFGRKVSVRDALELRFRPILGARENEISLITQITEQKSNETSGVAWFASKAEIEEFEKRFEDCVLWPAPYLFASRVKGNGAVVCVYDDCLCGMLFADGEPMLYRWYALDGKNADELADELLEYAARMFADRELTTCIVKPEEDVGLQQTGDETLEQCRGAAMLNLSVSTVSAGAETEKFMAKIERYADIAARLGVIFLLFALLIFGVNTAQKSEFSSAPSEIYRTVLHESSANPVSSALQKLRAVSADDTGNSFETVYSRISSAWESLSVRPKIDELRYSSDVVQLSGSAQEASVVDAFRKALADSGFKAVTDNVQQVQKQGMRFTISLTEEKKQ